MPRDVIGECFKFVMTLKTSGHRAESLETLLRPVPGDENPSGRSLQYDRVYDLIKEARRADDQNAPRDIWAKDLKTADWGEVSRLCQDALTRQSKDLQLCGWLTEAWLHLEGLSGLRRGVELTLQLAESYWETIHPSMSSGLDFRVAPFVWMNEKLVPSLGSVGLVGHAESGEGSATWDDWKRALWLDKMLARDPKDEDIRRELDGAVSLSDFTKLCAQTPELFFRDNIALLEDTIEVSRSLEAFLDDRLGQDSPSLVRFRSTLNDLLSWNQVVLRDGGARVDLDEGLETMEHDGADGEKDSVGIPAAPSGKIKDRAEAYRMLSAAASYLKSVEPHSPTPYLVLKAVSWGGKSLDDLLREFVSEGLDLNALFTFLGIQPGGKDR